MKKLLTILILLISSGASARELFVTCRQDSWQRVSGKYPLFSLKEKTCVLMTVRFWENAKNESSAYCENWREEAGISTLISSAHVFESAEECQGEHEAFLGKGLNDIRPVITPMHWGTGYLSYVDTVTPYVDGDGKEHPRWVRKDGQWYCSLPGQNFYARYENLLGQQLLYIEGISLGTQVFELVSMQGIKLFWKNQDPRSPYVNAHNLVSGMGGNDFILSDDRGNVIGNYKVTYLLGNQRQATLSCF